MIDLKLKAKAIVAVRKRKRAEEKAKQAVQAREDALVERLLSTLVLPIPKDGKDAVAPSMDAILAELIPLIPEPKHTTVVQEVNPTDMEVFIKGLLPEIQPEDRPAVEQITNETTIDISDEKLEGFVTKKEMEKHLLNIQRAISSGQSGGKAVNPQVAENAEEIQELSEALNNLITTLSAQGLTTQDILRSIEAVATHTQEELELLNARTEEAYDTKIDKKDIT